MPSRPSAILALASLLAVPPAFAQMPPNIDMAAMQKWSAAKIIHYEVVGEITLKGLQIPPTDADLYADVTDRVKLSFDWDKQKNVLVGTPVFTNEAAKVSNVVGMDKGQPGKRQCPTGKINGAFEYFDITAVRQPKRGEALELAGKRIHPETQVAEACGNALKTYKGAVRDVTEFIFPPDPTLLATGGAHGVKTIRISPDGKSIVMSALNNKWVWTYTPTIK